MFVDYKGVYYMNKQVCRVLVLFLVFFVFISLISAITYADEHDDFYDDCEEVGDCDEGPDHDDDHCEEVGDCDGGTQDYCGDGTCTDTEKYAIDPCPADCCGDGYCSPYEDQYCPGDCDDVEPDPVLESEYDSGISEVISTSTSWDSLEPFTVEFEITNYNTETAINWNVELIGPLGSVITSNSGDTSFLSSEESELVATTFSGLPVGEISVNIAVDPIDGEDIDTNDNLVENALIISIYSNTPEVPGRDGPIVDIEKFDAGILKITNVEYNFDTQKFSFDVEVINYLSLVSFNLDYVVVDSNGQSVAETKASTEILNTDEKKTLSGEIQTPVLNDGNYYIAVQLNPIDYTEEDTSDNIGYSDYFTIGLTDDTIEDTTVDILVTNINAPTSANIDSNVDVSFTIESLDKPLNEIGQINYGIGIFDLDNNVLYDPEKIETLTNGNVKFSFNPKQIGLATNTKYYLGVFAGSTEFEESNINNNIIAGTDLNGQISQVDNTLTITFTGIETKAEVVPKKLEIIKKLEKPKVVPTKKVVKPVKKNAEQTTTINLVPKNAKKGPPKLLTKKPFKHAMYGGTLIKDPITGKLSPGLDALYLVNPDIIESLTRESAECVINNAANWITYRYNSKNDKLEPSPVGEPIEIKGNEGLIVAISSGDGCNLEGVLTPKSKSNPLQLSNKGWNLYALQPELEGKGIFDLECPLGTSVIEAYNLNNGKWNEMTSSNLIDGTSGNIWWTRSIFVRCA
jgi:hypothetical protein